VSAYLFVKKDKIAKTSLSQTPLSDSDQEPGVFLICEDISPMWGFPPVWFWPKMQAICPQNQNTNPMIEAQTITIVLAEMIYGHKFS